ncbi:Gfo/Idh/MocA family protein [Microbacterium paludicola]|uniref:Gfo/Idh/MocA family protein n=1 Tax=Microbacterium paludicola TaxID=300019 RepID=UPI0011A1185E|nr:Gfo/Idh/MocA family oxidoreductase [Microbacterium paludicola]
MTTHGHSSATALERPVRVAVVGAGAFGTLHARAFAANRDCTLVSIVDHDEKRAAALAESVGATASHQNIDDALSSGGIDAVSVVTAGAFHLAPTLAALDAGASVLVEKPVVLTSSDGRILREAATRAEGFVMPAHILRFAGPYQELHHRVRHGAVGAPRALSFRRHRAADHDTLFPDVHPVLMTMVHDIDLALWLTGATARTVSARQVEAPGRNQPLAVWAEVETTDGASLSFQVSWSLPTGSLPDALEVIGDAGALSLSLSPRLHDFDAATPAVDDTLTPDTAHGALREEIRTFVDAVRFRTPPAAVTLDDALNGLALAERIIRSAEQNRCVS